MRGRSELRSPTWDLLEAIYDALLVAPARRKLGNRRVRARSTRGELHAASTETPQLARGTRDRARNRTDRPRCRAQADTAPRSPIRHRSWVGTMRPVDCGSSFDRSASRARRHDLLVRHVSRWRG